jgi:hypothetical protein
MGRHSRPKHRRSEEKAQLSAKNDKRQVKGKISGDDTDKKEKVTSVFVSLVLTIHFIHFRIPMNPKRFPELWKVREPPRQRPFNPTILKLKFLMPWTNSRNSSPGPKHPKFLSPLRVAQAKKLMRFALKPLIFSQTASTCHVHFRISSRTSVETPSKNNSRTSL